MLGILSDLLVEELWKEFFEGFAFPYGFFRAEEHAAFLVEACLKSLRVELFSRDMKHAGKGGSRVDKDNVAAAHGEIAN
ncbi:hypothetical protein E4G67_02935 [Candidatus Bathyarchaeota archaeon]|nr:MAG: hypothetical protein E4G67_02935 [Candidatus Bathyarchaeota archaeon]